MIDENMPLPDRIERALKRVISGDAPMRIPAEATDPDLVLSACRERIAELERFIRGLGCPEPEYCGIGSFRKCGICERKKALGL